MSSVNKKRGLGRGLSALMSDVSDQNVVVSDTKATSSTADLVAIDLIQPNPDQPRKSFSDEEIQDLAASIREKGIIQPLIVRRLGDGYQIVAGERRWRAAQIAQVHDVPVVVRDYTDLEVLEIAIIENVQRADLNPIEEAAGYRQLMERFGHTQEKLAEALGKSRSYIANLLRLLQLPADVVSMVERGDLSVGHARALITAAQPVVLAQEVVKKGLSVRETEKLVKQPVKPEFVRTGAAPEDKDADTRALERDLMAAVGMKVSLSHVPGAEGGKITLHYKSLEQLDDLCRRLSREV